MLSYQDAPLNYPYMNVQPPRAVLLRCFFPSKGSLQLISAVNMVSLSHLFVALSAVGGSLAAPTIPEAPDFIFSTDNFTDLVRRQDYTQNYQTSGNVQFSATTNGYSVTSSSAADFVVGRGWKTGAAR